MKLTEDRLKNLSEYNIPNAGLSDEELKQILDDYEIRERLDKEIKDLERFLKELEEARKYGEESNTLPISPIAGIIEKGQLELLKGIKEGKK